jgi:uncharacterized membrane protein
LEKILFYIFVSLVITVPLFYRIIRFGKVSWFVGREDLETNSNFIKAERLRFIQINIGYLYFLFHGAMIWGWLNIIIFVIISFFIGIFTEIIGTRTGLIFGGKYEFNLKLSPGPSISGIPLIIPLSWSGLTYMILNYCELVLGGSFNSLSNQNITLLLLPSILMVLLDLILDPIAVDEKRWSWKKSGAYYGVPLLNFVGWLFTTFLILFTFQLFQSDFKIDKEVDFFFKYSPGILFCLLPAIASRPCFERGLKAPGFLGLLFSLGLVALAVTQNN